MQKILCALTLMIWALSANAQGCDTWSPSRGCIGGNRSDSGTWSPRQGYGQQQPTAPVNAGPGQLVNCDPAGCWGAANGVRYNYVAGGNLQGTNGSFCVRGAGNTFSCN